MSEFAVVVVRIGKVEPHPNADRLEITNVHADENGQGGYPTIIAKGTFKTGDLAVYVPVDALVPVSRPEFAFLLPEPVRKDSMDDVAWAERLRKYEQEKTEKIRIKAKKLRSVFSMGLLIPVPAEPAYVEGDNVQELLGIDKYEPDESNRKSRPGGTIVGDTESCPFHFPEYTDIEGLRKWGGALIDDENVVITEKLHGSSARYVFMDGRLWVGSRHQIKKPPRQVTAEEFAAHDDINAGIERWNKREMFWHKWFWRFFGREAPRLSIAAPRPRDVPENTWWRIAREYDLATKLAKVPGLIVFGEIYGPIQDLKYGSPDKPQFRVYDAMDIGTGLFMSHDKLEAKMAELDLPVVPILYSGPWRKSLWDLAEGRTTISGEHTREGFVVRPAEERVHQRFGRVIFKLVGSGYLLR